MQMVVGAMVRELKCMKIFNQLAPIHHNKGRAMENFKYALFYLHFSELVPTKPQKRAKLYK